MFYYVEKFQVQANDAKIVTINSSIGGIKDLLETFRIILRFPYSTVTNLNAFRDVMAESEQVSNKGLYRSEMQSCKRQNRYIHQNH